MTHDLASEKLLELAYGDLTPREARDVAAHAEGCEQCREELAGIRETRSLMAQLPVEPPPEGGAGIVLAAAREAASARKRRAPALLPPWLWGGSLGAVAAVAIAVVSWQLTKTAPSEGLRAREGDLMGAAPPAVVAVAPVPKPALEEEKVASSEPLAQAEQPKAKDSGARMSPLSPNSLGERLGEGAKAKREAMKGESPLYPAPAASGAGRGALGSPLSPAPAGGRRAEGRDDAEGAAGSGALGSAGAKADRLGAGAGRGGGLALMGPAEAPLAPARPEAAAPAPAPAAPPANVWAPPASAAAPKARAPSGAAEEREQLADSYGAPAEKAARRAEAAKASAEAEARRLPRPRPSERKSAGPEQGRAAALRAEAAPGSVETRSFDGCPGERRRTVERAGDGTVLRYVREGAQRTIEHRYSPDGRLVAATVTEGTARRALPLDTPGLVRDARDAGIDAPPRCGP